ncbi:MAG: AmmeMemoRadiSam system protein A [Bacillota bacterium]
MSSTKEQSIYTQIARRSLENRIKGRTLLKLPEELPPVLTRPGAAFVSLKKKGALRGCIGTIQPLQENLAAEIAANALSAALRDPRFPPVTEAELDELEISVDILSDPEKVEDASALDPRRYGVIVRARGRSGLLLPDLEGVDTVEQQLDIARRKAGIYPDEPVETYRFEVKRYF